MKRLDKITKALEQAHVYAKSSTGGWLWPSIIEQLEYLRDVESGRNTDLTRISELSIGAMAAKNIEDRDEPFANLLYEIEDEAERHFNK